MPTAPNHPGRPGPPESRISAPVATKPKRPASYDLKAQDRRRNLAIQIGLTAVVVIFAVALVLYIVMSNDKKPAAGDAKAVRVASGQLIKNDKGEPKAVLSVYEDFQCPHCRDFEAQYSATINKLIDTGAVAADYTMVAILDSPSNQNYSSRAANAGYCVADESTDAFRRFHTALFAQQPAEGSGTAPTNAQLIETARQAGAASPKLSDCINNGKYLNMVQGLAEAAKITATPTIRINGQDWSPSTPDALVAKIKEIVGDVPGLNAASAPAAS
ncbi:MAG: hypothetical protein JWR37_5516 [Mycobacterium sp.]|nr:hypothetical protein [Mycobacterium sp.]